MKIKIKIFGKINKSQAKSSLKALEIYKQTGGPVPKSVMAKARKEATKATKQTGDSSNIVKGTNISVHSKQRGNPQRTLKNKSKESQLERLTDKRKSREMDRIKQSQPDGKGINIKTSGKGYNDSQLSIPGLEQKQ